MISRRPFIGLWKAPAILLAMMLLGGWWHGGVGGSATIVPKTANFNIASAASGTIYTNEGASAQITGTIQSNTAGLDYGFVVQNSNGIVIQLPAGATAWIGSTSTSVGGTLTSTTVTGQIEILAINSTTWTAISTGTWVAQ